MDDIKPPPNDVVTEQENPIPEPVAEQQITTAPQELAAEAPSEAEPSQNVQQPSVEAAVNKQPVQTKPKNTSSVPVLPIFLAIVLAGGMIAVAVFLALSKSN